MQTLLTLKRFVRSNDKRTENLLRKWFGSNGNHVKKRVESVLHKTSTWLSKVTFYCLYSNDGTSIQAQINPDTGKTILVDSSDRLFAYVYPHQLSAIYLGLGFFSASEIGSDTKFGTIIHEMTHFWLSGNTEDLHYGRTHCLDLAARNSSAALHNADNFQYFTEDWLHG